MQNLRLADKTFEEETECPVCHTEFHLKNNVLIPSYGFAAKKEKRKESNKEASRKGAVGSLLQGLEDTPFRLVHPIRRRNR